MPTQPADADLAIIGMPTDTASRMRCTRRTADITAPTVVMVLGRAGAYRGYRAGAYRGYRAGAYRGYRAGAYRGYRGGRRR
jgi:hypothetical protein